MIITLLQYIGFGGAALGFTFLSFNYLLPGLVVSLVGNSILIYYGIITNQYALSMANSIYNSVIIVGLIKYFMEKK